MRNSNKKTNNLLKRGNTNVVNIREEPKRTSHQSKASDKVTHKGFCYYNRKVNTESDDIRYSDNKPSRKLYILPKGNLQRTNKLNRKSYSRQIQESKILQGKSYDYANRYTLTQFNANDLKNQTCFGLSAGGLLKKNTRKPHNAKQSYINNSSGSNLFSSNIQNSSTKKYKGPYDKMLKRGYEGGCNKPIEIKSIPRPKMQQKRMATEVNENNVDRVQKLTNEVYQSKQTNNYIRNSHENVFQSPKTVNRLELEIIEQIGQGTFGKVYKARNIETGEIVAVKKVLQDKKYKSRQMEIIQILDSKFTMRVLNTFITFQSQRGQKQQYLNIVMDHYDCNLYEYLGRHRNMSNTLQLKSIIYQMFRGLLYIHSLGICHRDIKPHNMLVKNGRVSLCDFGSAKVLKKGEVNLSYICSRCYRAPQLIFGSVQYTTQIDIWAAGCIILQIINKVPLFIGQNSLDHLVQVIKVMGTPSKSQVMAMNPEYDLNQYDFPMIPKREWAKLFPDVDRALIDLINKIMRYSPNMRLTAVEVLAHQYFDDIRDQDLQNQIRLITKTKDFFDFNREELKQMGAFSQKIIPDWYRKQKSVSKPKRQSKESKCNINMNLR